MISKHFGSKWLPLEKIPDWLILAQCSFQCAISLSVQINKLIDTVAYYKYEINGLENFSAH